jgi:hypothetical protein
VVRIEIASVKLERGAGLEFWGCHGGRE